MSVDEFFQADFFTLNLIVSNIEEIGRDEWERTRMMVWAALAPNSKKKLQPKDILQFPWEKAEAVQSAKSSKEQFDEVCRMFQL